MILSKYVCVFLISMSLNSLTLGQRYDAVFDEVVDLVENHFYDSDQLGKSWREIVQAERQKLVAIGSRKELESLINNLLSSLNASHTQYFSVHNPKRYQLLGVFHQLFDSKQTDLFVYKGIGISTN